jgi:uncharacterized protein (DUF934 family)
MPIIWTENGVIENDPWSLTGLESDGRRLLGLSEALEQDTDNASLGVVLQPSEDVRALAPLLGRIELVALTFPAFSDGRAFSQAMLLRDRYGYRGELRAVGTVLLDQVPLMLRVGFTSFEVDHESTIERLKQKRFAGIGLHYQPSARPADQAGGYSWRRTAILNG